MLQILRGKKSGFMVKVVLGLVVIGFSFFGIESYFVANPNLSVARVGDKQISQDEFRERFTQYQQRVAEMAGGNIDPAFFQNPQVRRQVLEQMIDEEVLVAANDRLGVSVPPARVRDEIAAVPAFQNDGRFDPNQYRLLLSSQGMSPRAFEERVRQDIAVRELPAQIGATTLVTDAEIDRYLALREQKRDFRFVLLDPPAADDTAIADSDIESWYEANQDHFMQPEEVSVRYLELTAADVEVEDTPDEGQLLEIYERESARFVTPEERLASHILVKVDAPGGPEQQKEALERAEAIEAQLAGGADFAEVARAESADLGSRNTGGDLGWLEKGMTDEAFEEALFALDKGEVSAPVLGSDGYHIIELRDIREGDTRSFDEVRDDLAAEFMRTARERAFTEAAGELTDLTYQDPSSLDAAARALGLEVKSTPLFSRIGGPGIAANAAVREAAFSEAVLTQEMNSDPIELDPDHVVVLRLAQHKPATPRPLDEVRAEVEGAIRAERASEAARARAERLFAEAEKAGTLDVLAGAAGADDADNPDEDEADEDKADEALQVQTQSGVGRQGATVDSELVEAVFAMPRPVGDTPVLKQVALAGDRYALVQLEAVRDADPDNLDAATRAAARSTLEQAETSVATREFIDALRRDTRIRVYEQRLAEL